jgi:hypothetical protein
MLNEILKGQGTVLVDQNAADKARTEERRREHRMPVDEQIRVYVMDGVNGLDVLHGKVTDVSKSGVGLTVPTPLTVGDRIWLEAPDPRANIPRGLAVASIGATAGTITFYIVVHCSQINLGLFAVGAQKDEPIRLPKRQH